MKYCSNCGKKLVDGADVCMNCGKLVSNVKPKSDVSQEDSGSNWFIVLGIFMPMIGLILYLVWKNTMPDTAHKCGLGALIGVISGIAIWLICLFLFMIPFIFWI